MPPLRITIMPPAPKAPPMTFRRTSGYGHSPKASSMRKGTLVKHLSGPLTKISS